MRTNIKATGMELTAEIQDYVEKRLLTLERFLQNKDDDESICQIEVGKTTGHHRKGDIFRAEMNIQTHGRHLRAVAEESDVSAAIDLVKDEMERQLTQGKEKRLSLVRRSAAKLKNVVKGLYPWRKKK